MKRYEIQTFGELYDAQEDEQGPWVKHEDAAARVAQVERDLAEAVKALREVVAAEALKANPGWRWVDIDSIKTLLSRLAKPEARKEGAP